MQSRSVMCLIRPCVVFSPFFTNWTGRTYCLIFKYYFFLPKSFMSSSTLNSRVGPSVLYISAGILSTPELFVVQGLISSSVDTYVILLLPQSEFNYCLFLYLRFTIQMTDWLSNSWTCSLYLFLMPYLFPVKLSTLFLQKYVWN